LAESIDNIVVTYLQINPLELPGRLLEVGFDSC